MAFLQGIFMKCGGFLAVLAAMMMAGCGSSDRPESRAVESSGPSKPVLIGFSLGGVRMERWKKDEKYIELRAHELGAKVMGLSANDNADLQNSQAENLLMQGVDVLLVVPQNAEESSKIVEMAHQAGVKVIAYDRIIQNCALDYYVSFDNEKVGEYQARGVIQALDLTRTNHLIYIGGSPVDNNSQQLKKGSMRVLEPLIQSGKVVMELETFTDDWSLQKAYLDTQDFLRKGLPLHGVVAANDALAAGVLQALQEHGLAGIPVSGQDAELSACQRVVQGTQTLTVYKPLQSLARMAVDMAVKVARNEPMAPNAVVNNGFQDVPSFLLGSIPVFRTNLNETVIQDGFHSYEAVFGTPPSKP